jgi:putative ABC transport system permease protein
MALPLWRALTRGTRALVNPRAADADADDEIRHFLDESAVDLESRGVPAEEARRRARAAWGHPMVLREEVRASGWEHVVAAAAADIRYGVRRLRRTPGFTAVAVSTLALGIGASTAIFSAINPILLASLPYPDATRVVSVLENGRTGAGTFAVARALVPRTRAFDAIAVSRRWQPTITGTGAPERFEGQRVSAAYFAVLGIAPSIGRDFTADDDRLQGPRLVIVSDAFWRRRLAADPAVAGQAIRLDDTPYTVIGVMPAGFENVVAPDADLWTPLQYDAALPVNGREWGHHLLTLARLARGVTIDGASREADAAGRALLAERRPESYDPTTRFSVEPLQASLVRGVQPVLLVIAGAVLLVLVIACVNVTSLLLARGALRRGEFALRAALGAGRGRLVRQVLTESVLLAAMGGAAGLALAAAAVRALVVIAPAGLPRADAIQLDSQVLAFAIGVSTIVGLAFGMLPAFDAAGANPHRDIQDSTQRATGHGRTRRVLVVAEVALAFVLLVGAGLLLRSVAEILAVPIGFDASSLLTFQVQLVGRRFAPAEAGAAFYQQALDAVRRVPGVVAAGATSQLPLSGDRDEYGARFPDDQGQPAAAFPVFRYAVTPGYFEASGVPIRRGRAIDASDRRGAPAVAVISASLAAARFGARDPIGRQLRLGPAGPFTIVGIAGDVRQVSLASVDAWAVYINIEQSWFTDRAMSFVVRTRGNPAALGSAARDAVWSIDKDQPVVRIATMPDLVEASQSERRFALIVFEGFALASLLLAAIGIYGILAGGVAERTREIGVRAALGATRPQIVGLIARQGFALTVVGVFLGVGGAAYASRGLSTLLFGVTPLDPRTYASVVALLAGVAVLACAIPAWRAARVDPAITLRAE